MARELSPSYPAFAKASTPIVISLGGSLVNPQGPDFSYLRRFAAFCRMNLSKRRAVFIVGGGSLCREYQNTARKLGTPSDSDLDWIGVYATWLNASLLKAALDSQGQGTPGIITDPSKPLAIAKSSKPGIAVGGGWKPGWSTDYDAVMIAKQLSAPLVINMSNQDFVYTADPRKDPAARPLRQLSWKEFSSMFSADWSPGSHVPFDPIAAKLAMTSDIAVAFMGASLPNLAKTLSGKPFRGTLIR
ncbi:hypothetical protein AUJ68_04540 [Candidatus Woesearchaeota archaeon CG1_02_57_44]|nr:MAG: hypothetical protein AUJ68_04540 [Candidatus Woesearchaeota archaeon CG1_02_57_44]